MTVSVTLTFPDVDAALLALAKLASVPTLHLETTAGMNATEVRERVAEAVAATADVDILQPPGVVEVPMPAPAPVPVEQTTKRRGRPPKAETVSTVPPPAPAAEPITKEAAHAKFKETNDKVGIKQCIAALNRLGVKRFALLDPTQYGELVKLCDRAIAGEDLTKAIE